MMTLHTHNTVSFIRLSRSSPGPLQVSLFLVQLFFLMHLFSPPPYPSTKFLILPPGCLWGYRYLWLSSFTSKSGLFPVSKQQSFSFSFFVSPQSAVVIPVVGPLPVKWLLVFYWFGQVLSPGYKCRTDATYLYSVNQYILCLHI